MPRMKLFQALACNMRIDLCGRNVSMPQQKLDHTQVGTVIQKVRGKSMTKDVRR